MGEFGPYSEKDPSVIEHEYTPDPPVEGVDYVVDVVNSMEGPQETLIRRHRP